MRIFLSGAPLLLLFGLLVGSQVGEAEPIADARVKALLDEEDLNYTIDKTGHFRLILGYADERSQLVLVNSGTETLGPMEVREVWSVGYSNESEVPAEIALRLLEANATYKLGAWQISRGPKGKLGVFSARIAARTDAKTLHKVIQVVASTAETMEHELLGSDEY